MDNMLYITISGLFSELIEIVVKNFKKYLLYFTYDLYVLFI